MPAIGNTSAADKPYVIRRSDEQAPDQLGTGLGVLFRKPPQSEGRILTEGIGPTALNLTTEEVYRALEFTTVEMRSALRLLRDAIGWCDRALSADSLGELFQADDAMVNVQIIMPELFCCRALGDGLAEIVNAIQSSFENLKGGAFERSQISSIRRALIAIQNEPRLSFERALEFVGAMESTGLMVEPALIDTLSEWLGE
jgi:hypothetical protein